jgi:hypothetical protein
MAKAKSKATFMVADGAGGMVNVQDRRFEAGDWPIRFEIKGEDADRWLRYFNAECRQRQWSSSSLGQHEPSENSGTTTVSTGSADGPSLTVIWERKRGKALRVRARSGGVPEFALAEAQELFERVNERCRSGAMEHIYRRGQLEYDGLPWCGELWLDETLRLAPPSRQDETALFGPRVILVDSLVPCIGPVESAFVFDRNLHELSAFLSVVVGLAIRVPKAARGWTWTFTDDVLDCAVRSLGYWIAARPRQAGDEPASNRIGSPSEDDGDSPGCLTATPETVLVTTMRSTLSATSSVARAGNRSYFPSASRYSITTLRPST